MVSLIADMDVLKIKEQIKNKYDKKLEKTKDSLPHLKIYWFFKKKWGYSAINNQ